MSARASVSEAQDIDASSSILPSPVLSAVIPVYDESENLPELYRRLSTTFSALGVEYELLFVNDGSRDATAEILNDLALIDGRVVVLHLSRNFGHQSALTAGLEHARGDAVVVLDGDLQDPPEVVPRLVERWREGYDVVYAVRTKRKEGFAKRLAYAVFYRLLHASAMHDMPLDSGDFCLMDRRAVDAVNRLPERSRYVRGLRSYVGFQQIGVEYERDARLGGRAKYTFGKLLKLALDGLIGFSHLPARLLSLAAAVSITLGLVVAVVMASGWLLTAVSPAGWVVVLAAVLLLAGANLLGLAGLAVYLAQIVIEVKQRPPYFIGEKTRKIPGFVVNHAGRFSEHRPRPDGEAVDQAARG